MDPLAYGMLPADTCLQELRKIPGIEDILAAIVPYTQRHVAHLDRLLCSSYVLDYSLSRLNYIAEDIAASE